MRRPDYQKKYWKAQRERLKAKQGEYGGEGRPSVLDADGIDELLFMLRVVHSEPRFDLFKCASVPSPLSTESASAAT